MAGKFRQKRITPARRSRRWTVCVDPILAARLEQLASDRKISLSALSEQLFVSAIKSTEHKVMEHAHV